MRPLLIQGEQVLFILAPCCFHIMYACIQLYVTGKYLKPEQHCPKIQEVKIRILLFLWNKLL